MIGRDVSGSFSVADRENVIGALVNVVKREEVNVKR